ncbi:type VI secretion system protein VasD [Izhakiella capsodis]|uniref:Type VI secretion system protein VasD n=1 Tax=Izhakiella capsodis TaxID=1367852 RepID=A0A1I5A2L4_9GAMM|nr:type VI secretion system lipoprotein TssJ [Izhakiella capsodis]SFN56744.1 type VI secretion system protein VasD [Izhakiella capsodis]
MRIRENNIADVFKNGIWKKVMAIVSCLMLLSCSSSRNDSEKENEIKEIIITLQAENNINPDKYGNASPVKVIIYPLKEHDPFFAGDIYNQEEISNKDNVSGAEKMGEYIISPAEEIKLRLPFNKENKMLGIVTEYRDITHSVWKVVYPIPRKPKEPWYRIFWPIEEIWQPELTVHLEYLTTSIKK